MDYVTVEELGAYVRQDLTDDDLAAYACSAASEVVRSYMDREVGADTVTEVLDGTGSDALMLSQAPVTDVIDCTIYPDDPDYIEELVRGVDFALLPDSGILIRIGGYAWPTGRQTISVEYSFGYEEVPGDVGLIALQCASRIFTNGQTESLTLGDMTIRNVSGAGGLTDHERRVLNGRKL